MKANKDMQLLYGRNESINGLYVCVLYWPLPHTWRWHGKAPTDQLPPMVLCHWWRTRVASQRSIRIKNMANVKLEQSTATTIEIPAAKGM